MKQENFVVTIENDDSPIIITVPHGGMPAHYASWLENFFQKRTKSENSEENFIKGEKIVTGGDGQIMHIVGDILKEYPANAIIGLLPRSFVDYNRFVPEVAYVDNKVKPFYDAYHDAISNTIERLKKKRSIIFLFDFHGFSKQPMDNIEFDIIIGTDGKTSPLKADNFMFYFFEEKYQVFCRGVNNFPEFESEIYRGNTTNLVYHEKYDVDSMLVEISPKFRNSKEFGVELSKDIASYFRAIHTNANSIEDKKEIEEIIDTAVTNLAIDFYMRRDCNK